MHYLIQVHKKNKEMYNIVLFSAQINKNNMKQTAVEWLVGKILTKDEIYDDYGNVIAYKLINTFTSSEDFSKYVEQAKAMDEKNLKDSFVAGAGMGEMFNNENRCFVSDAEQYLKQTFKSA